MREGARLLLARHGQHDWLIPPINRFAGRLPGVHLNGTGRRQAEALAARLVADPPDRIVCSPIDRTRETAAIVAARLGLPTTTDDRLIETGMGPWEGAPVSEVMVRYPDAWAAWQTAPTQASVPGLEPVEAIGERMLGAARDYAALEGATLLVSHKDPLLALACRLLDLPLDAMRRMETGCGSLTIFEIAGGRPTLVTLNSGSV